MDHFQIFSLNPNFLDLLKLVMKIKQRSMGSLECLDSQLLCLWQYYLNKQIYHTLHTAKNL